MLAQVDTARAAVGNEGVQRFRLWLGAPLSRLKSATIGLNWAVLGSVVRTSGSADRLCRAGQFEAGIVLYERATLRLLELPGREHSAMFAWQSASPGDPVTDASFPSEVRLARARLRAAAFEKLGELRRRSSASISAQNTS